MNVNTIISKLAPDYVYEKKKKVTSNKLAHITQTKFDFSIGFDSFLRCLIYGTKYQFDLEKERIIETLSNFEFNEMMNSKKTLIMINQNIVNNEVILFLSGFYEMNIFVYSTKSKIMKIYYLEDTLCVNKQSNLVFLTQNPNTLEQGYQVREQSQLFNYKDDYIQGLLESIYIIPIGLIENKKLITSEKLDSVDFITGKIEPIKEFITEDSIFNPSSQITLKDDFDIDNFDIVQFTKQFNKKKFLLELHSISAH